MSNRLAMEVPEFRDDAEALRFASDKSREVLWISDRALSRVLYVSPAYEEMFGRPAAELYADSASFLSTVHPDDRERVVASVIRLRRRRHVDVEYRVIQPDGTYRWIRTRAFPVSEPDADSDRTIGIAEDITEQKRREATARFLAEASRVFGEVLAYEETVRRVAELAVPYLADWCSVDVLDGERVRRITAMGSAGWAETTIASTWSPLADTTQGPGHVLRTGQPELHRQACPTLVGEIGPTVEQLALFTSLDVCSVMILPMSARGRVLGAISLVATSGREYTDQDLELATEYAHRAAVAVDNAQLYQQVVAANSAKSDFLAIVSHELRTPLNAIAGYADLLDLQVKGPLTPGQQAQLQGIKANTRQLVQIIDQILSFSQLEMGGEHLRVEPIDLGAWAREIAMSASSQARAKGLRFRLQVPQHGVEVETDRNKLTRAVNHLVNNAVKFTERGEIRLAVRRDDTQVSIIVRDTGIGIPPEQRDRIFEPFWQAEHPPTRRAGGTGLGLSMTHRLVRLLGGRITVESEVGQGSTFTVHIPLRLRPAGEN